MQKYNIRKAFTLVELIVTAVAAIVVILGVVGIIANGHKGYRRLWNRENRGVVPDAYVARRTFDRIVRKSIIDRYDPSADLIDGSNVLYVYYFSDPDPRNSAIQYPDMYAKFYLNSVEKQLWLDRGTVAAETFMIPIPENPILTSTTSSMVLANDVTAPASGIFSVQGNSMRMVLILDSESNAAAGVSKIETLKMTVTTTAIMHNRIIK